MKGKLIAEEVAGVERIWILAMQDDLKHQDTYISLSKELQIFNYNGILIIADCHRKSLSQWSEGKLCPGEGKL